MWWLSLVRGGFCIACFYFPPSFLLAWCLLVNFGFSVVARFALYLALPYVQENSGGMLQSPFEALILEYFHLMPLYTFTVQQIRR